MPKKFVVHAYYECVDKWLVDAENEQEAVELVAQKRLEHCEPNESSIFVYDKDTEVEEVEEG